ncbi:hypothetical protein M422DRAFT_262335 [Sphaerobolus stellatus SS14]|uniref:Unplaced genomic scaffold SPHSTscaffold_114, whole genome shotgun sequence n=1 Tax=Sphaerobolus stellatus (strain SS14) TaxID=990650 RepID=A0A0C9VCY3_SPHS4|nr:hypothetical protein M422DRAFT_262335 [Sphaerobolus stellatus SS14]
MLNPSSFLLVAALLVSNTHAASLKVYNKCTGTVFLNTASSSGTIAHNVLLGAGKSTDMRISANWNGAINVGTGCDASGRTCTTGGPTWDGRTPFSRAELNYAAIPGTVIYDISFIYGANVGMKISSSGGTGCANFACTLPKGCPIRGPGANSCYSGCCRSAAECKAKGALPPGGGGCPKNGYAGPHSDFFYKNCPNVYAFPFNDGAEGGKPANYVVSQCKNTAITVTLCPGETTHIPKSLGLLLQGEAQQQMSRPWDASFDEYDPQALEDEVFDSSDYLALDSGSYEEDF